MNTKKYQDQDWFNVRAERRKQAVEVTLASIRLRARKTKTVKSRPDPFGPGLTGASRPS
ncbi:MAG: hypothetical protein ACK4N4_07665 [Burkholderiales bacterium]